MWRILTPRFDESAKAFVECDVCHKESQTLATFKPDPEDKLFREIIPNHLGGEGWVITNSSHICPGCKVRRFQ